MESTESASFWDNKYLKNETAWDMKIPTPVFEELLGAQEYVQPGKILIAGSGIGYDAVLAAEKGYDVYAVDFSVEAIRLSKNLAESRNVKMNFLLDDIFMLDSRYKNHFDYVYDYVTYCAIIPERRKEYAGKISNFLKPGGKLIALLFPIEDRKGGPPYAVDVQEFYDLFSKHLQLKFSSREINTIKPRRGRELLQIYLKKENSINADQS